MCLITKKVKVRVDGRNRKYYEKKGYCIPTYINKDGREKVKKGTEIEVDVFDLPLGSMAKIEVRCDGCGKQKHISYFDYVNRKHKENDGYYCVKCVHTIFNSGENNHNYNENLSDEYRNHERIYNEYFDFLNSVKAKYNGRCVICCSNKNTIVHHLDSYTANKDKRTDINNGIVLCEECHKAFHRKYGYGNNTRSQFEKWSGLIITDSDNNFKLPDREIYCFETNITYPNSRIASNELCVPKKQINAVCNPNSIPKSAHGYHFILKEKLDSMTDEEIARFKEKWNPVQYKKVICLTTNKIYNRVSEINNDYPYISKNMVSQCCRNKTILYGEDVDTKEKLKWMYYEDYIALKE